jgi:hypothetical protein
MKSLLHAFRLCGHLEHNAYCKVIVAYNINLNDWEDKIIIQNLKYRLISILARKQLNN